MAIVTVLLAATGLFAGEIEPLQVREVANGERRLSGLEDLIASPQPGAQIRTVEAQGLSLEHVYYRACPAVTNQEPAGIEQTLW